MTHNWNIQKGAKVERLSELELRNKLRNGSFSGIELVRMEGETEWTPLHERPIFSQEVAYVGDARRAAWWRAVRGYAGHLAAFLGVMIFLGFPWWGIFWGIAVLGHTARTLPAIRGLFTETRTPTLPNTARPARADDAFLHQLESALADLESHGETVERFREQARALHQRRLALDAAVITEDVAALEVELTERRAVAESAPSAQDAEIFFTEVQALSARLDALKAARQRRDRLAAQERKLLHELEGARLAMLSMDDEADQPEIHSRLAEIQGRLAAEEEVAEKLSAARQAGQRIPQR